MKENAYKLIKQITIIIQTQEKKNTKRNESVQWNYTRIWIENATKRT